MLSKRLTLVLVFLFSAYLNMAQFCAPLGGSPDGAFPVCGNITLLMPAVPPCGGTHEIYVPGCTGKGKFFFDKNPYWYKFNCYQTGSFGFEITPAVPADDFDWQLFDVTGHPATAVFYVNQVVVVAANWANTAGSTGASAAGANQTQCSSDVPGSRNSYAAMPTLLAGHHYMLLTSHAVGTGGYTIAFMGGTAELTDPVLPHMTSVSTSCPGSPLCVKFNRKLKCTSMGGQNTSQSDGSEFSILPALANVIGASKIGCENSYETDSIILSLDHSLPPGNYDLVIQNGFDGNTVSDFCDRFVPVGERFPFVVNPVHLPHLDSIIQPGCSPSELQLYFKNPIHCASISPNGSQFTVTGTAPVSVIHAIGSCSTGPEGTAHIIRIKLSAPIYGKGSFQVRLITGNDGNQLRDECGFVLPVGETVNFVTWDTVSALFKYTVRMGCMQDTIDFMHDGGNAVNSWKWNFDDLRTSTEQNPRVLYDTFGLKQVSLVVSNGGCSDTSRATIPLDNELKAGFETLDVVCPGQRVSFKDTSIGNIVSWLWTFGNGNTSSLTSPAPQVYPSPPVTTVVRAQLIVQNNMGCTSVAAKNLSLADRCLVYVPGAFTPNNDGLNDYLYPLNVYHARGFRFKVFNRYGQVVFESADPSNRWNGRYKGQVADPGTYVWTLHYVDANSGETFEQQGTSLLIR
jgi:gliding motility-associated-like protein